MRTDPKVPELNKCRQVFEEAILQLAADDGSDRPGMHSLIYPRRGDSHERALNEAARALAALWSRP